MPIVPLGPPVPATVPAPEQSAQTFRYQIWNITRWELEAVVPMVQVSFSWGFLSAGTFQGTVCLDDPLIESLQLGDPDVWIRTCCVFVEMITTASDGRKTSQLIWGGIIWNITDGQQWGQAQIQASEIWSYFASKRIQAQDYSNPPGPFWLYTPDDPLNIAAQLIHDAVGVVYSAFVLAPSGPLTIAINGSTPHEEWVTVAYPYNQLQKIGAMFQNLACMAPGIGFDFGIDLAWSTPSAVNPTPVPELTLNLDYPRRGLTAPNSPLKLNAATAVAGSGGSPLSWPSDGTVGGNKMYETAGGLGGLSSIQEDLATLQAGAPLIEELKSQSAVQYPDQLQALCTNDLALTKQPTITPSITVATNDPNLPVGRPRIGDDVWVTIPKLARDGNTRFYPRKPDGWQGWLRIIGANVTIADVGVSTVQWQFNVPPILTV